MSETKSAVYLDRVEFARATHEGVPLIVLTLYGYTPHGAVKIDTVAIGWESALKLADQLYGEATEIRNQEILSERHEGS